MYKTTKEFTASNGPNQERAMALRESGRYGEATLVLQSWLACNSQDASAYALLAQVLSLDKQDEQAWVALNTALSIKPDLPLVQRNHARLLLKKQNLDEALQAAQVAYQGDPADPENQLVLAAALGAKGQNQQALQLVTDALQSRPNYAEAFANRALLKLRGNDMVGALTDAEKALSIKPHMGQLWGMVGSIRYQLKDLPGAMKALEKAIDYESDNVAHLLHLGELKRQAGEMQATIVLLEKAVAIAPDNVGAWVNLGKALQHAGRISEAQAAYARALEIEPKQAEVAANLGNTLQALGRLDEAAASYRRALQIKPDLAEAHSNLGVALRALGRLDEAEVSLRRALEINPNFAEGHYNLGKALQGLERNDEAIACYQRTLVIKPDRAEAHNNLGTALKDLGRLDDALASLRRALQCKPDYALAHSNLLFILNYHPDKSAEEIYAAYQEYDQCFGLPYRSKWRDHSNNLERQRRLKVGYVSPDFRKHSTQHFLEPLLSQHDRNTVEIYAYAELTQEDEVTARYRGYTDHWVSTRGMSDDALAERIRADGIDILMDLAGHTAQNRLSVFARKPSPVSVSWLGYGYTTGLTAVDYFLTDETSAPKGSEGLFSETPWRLATPGFAYSSAKGMGEVGPLPAAGQGCVTFGTLTRAVRINHRTIRVWSEILKRVAGSRLVIDSCNFADCPAQEGLAAKFAAHGIGRERLDIGFHSPPWDVLRSMDIGLDCFPHNSGATLLEALYMGVPFVTLAGRPSVGRIGSSILKGAGHQEWIARTEDEYVEKAVALASDLPALACLRAGLRTEIESSPLMDEAGFARKVEAAYREMWVKWCERNP